MQILSFTHIMRIFRYLKRNKTCIHIVVDIFSNFHVYLVGLLFPYKYVHCLLLVFSYIKKLVRSLFIAHFSALWIKNVTTVKFIFFLWNCFCGEIVI